MLKLTGRLCPALVILAILLSVHSSAHDVITTPITFSREISRLVYNRCAVCHREGGIAFSLLTYAEARPWAKAIKEEVLERRMPPWGAVKGFGEFQDDQGLTGEQLELIADWVEGGAPEGDPKYLPKLPDFQPAASAGPAPAGIPVESELTLTTAVAVAGVRAKGVPEGSSFMAVAERPDGTIEPLVWIYDYHPRFDHPYWYNAPLRFQAGTKIEIAPRGAGSIALLMRNPAARSKPRDHR
ncbi:MAG: cytochrome c [Acidobacteriia bacterium]|nr:cytochrome c [Terriglobia bacterium]